MFRKRSKTHRNNAAVLRSLKKGDNIYLSLSGTTYRGRTPQYINITPPYTITGLTQPDRWVKAAPGIPFVRAHGLNK